MTTPEVMFRIMMSGININDRTNEFFNVLGLPLKDKIKIDCCNRLYLFGTQLNEKTTDAELKRIIQATPKNSWHGEIDFQTGKWAANPDQLQTKSKNFFDLLRQLGIKYDS